MVDAKIKKRKVSKKTKKSWRKHVDIKDVDKFLDNKRLEERLGVPFSEREDSQLFVIDKSKTVRNTSSKQVARLALKNKEPKCFASLKPHTQVPDPISKRNHVRLKGQNKILKNKTLTKTITNIKKNIKKKEIKDDIWTSTDICKLPDELTEWMSSDSIRHTIKHLGVQKRKLPASLHKKPSVLPVVEVPHPGMSYNPSYTDHQELLHQIAQKELELIKQEEHLNRVTTQMFKKIPLNKKEEYLMKEMSEGLPTKQVTATLKSAEDNNEEDLSVTVANSKSVKNAKKTLVQKRKQREQKQAATERIKNKINKKKISDIYKLKNLQQQIEIKEKKQELLRQKRTRKRERESIMPKTLGKTKFEPLEPDFQLANELTGNLRNCKPSQNLLKDRYKSLQQRNIIAPAVIKLKRDKAKVKKFVKPDHKINLDTTKLRLYSKV
ncbi:ribosome biogenesis protein NOP53 [Anoplolepis gracilipes]|uniref:ribosome biogenesis protein NOP53 n=1 Tax=Anoplolepis gracilipes TaxID=354296 RepID=UPI003BA2ECDD